MDKIISLQILLVLFTGCAAQSTSAVDYNDPYSIQEENYASYEDWVEEELSIIQYYTDCTNQELEYMRQIALQDHEYFREQMWLFNEQVDAFNQHWVESWIRKGWKRGKNEPVKNVDLWKRLLKAMEPHKVTYIWVKGHAGHAYNERCDLLATSSADGKELFEDPGVSE